MKAVNLSEEKDQKEVMKKMDDRNQREERMRQLREERRFGKKKGFLQVLNVFMKSN